MRVRLQLILFASFLMFSCASQKKETVQFSPERILDENVKKIKDVQKTVKSVDQFPRNIPKGQTQWETVGARDWCSGFWPGVLWYAYEQSNDPELKQGAMKSTEALRQIAYSPAENHDIGFMLYCSYGNGYRLTGNEDYKNVLLAAADTLATLYNPKVGSILSWPIKKSEFDHNTIVDNMMNLELLFWAAKNGGSKDLYDLSESHARVTMDYLVREDGSMFHLGSFDSETGKFLKGMTHQGYADDSMWARGQSWGIYGFAIAYRETGNEDFLKTSIKLADHFLKRLPEDGIPYWDFDDPKIPNSPKDASAAAVAACGMLELSELVEGTGLKQKYLDAAEGLLEKLSSDTYLSRDANQALLLHSTGHHPNNSEIDMPIVYADYYYMEALLRLKRLKSSK
ncbi:unsaturated chondroitin disaccharide hydrolase [Zobellia uliginosa]|uniref:Unsaturated chondroitin disaccharide hydrolase n=1 Tax=Zobellia uliginosa TaxID=143224 RepID=A0ABY1KM37_9FLAO|nr:glycoside hydrolase family 88 protein [Zobellia uliginosa]SIS48215.1 unsaturated chondroitin disaccharide hydrolase [Zobellia uliginosa]